VPARQLVHDVEPATEDLPAAHDKHGELPVVE
jgi:hypothetical protein